jgi:uncharacterized membrane protein YkvA (DUF1232 family)
MAIDETSSLSKPGLWRALLTQGRLAVRLLREPRVPLPPKLVPVLAALYLIVPLDFIPDLLPALGQLDDLGVIVLALETFLGICPAAAKAFHRDAIARGRKYSPMTPDGEVIEAEWRRE